MIKAVMFLFLSLGVPKLSNAQNKHITDSIDRLLKKEFRNTVRVDELSDTIYTVFLFNKQTKHLLAAVVTLRQKTGPSYETTYNFENEQLRKVRMIAAFSANEPIGRGIYYYLNNLLVSKSEEEIELLNPLDFITTANEILVKAKSKMKS